MKGEQVDFLDRSEQNKMAKIIQFPVAKEVVFIRETARILTIKQGKAAERFWQVTCRRLYGRLQVRGMGEADILAEMRKFSAAVHIQIQRQTAAAAVNSNPLGAA